MKLLARLVIKLGIIPERIEPGHPEQNGRLERFHRTLKADTANPPRENLRKQTGLEKYNEDSWPWGMKPWGKNPRGKNPRPATTSSRSYPSKPEYGDEVIVRRVRSTARSSGEEARST